MMRTSRSSRRTTNSLSLSKNKPSCLLLLLFFMMVVTLSLLLLAAIQQQQHIVPVEEYDLTSSSTANNIINKRIDPAVASKSSRSATTTTRRQLSTTTTSEHSSESSGVVKFVFVIGLEGTGHHLMGSLLRYSPDVVTVRDEYNLQPQLLELKNLLYGNYNSMFHSHCGGYGPDVDEKKTPRELEVRVAPPDELRKYGRRTNTKKQLMATEEDDEDDDDGDEKEEATQRRQRRRLGRRNTRDLQFRTPKKKKQEFKIDWPGGGDNNNNSNIKDIDIEKTFDGVVEHLKEIVRIVKEEEKRKQQQQPTASDDIHRRPTISVPLNAGGDVFEMASYPQNKDGCRPLKYPDLDLLYRACEQARVQCNHIYLYRDPYAIIKSTTIKRHFNSDILKAIHQYTSLLRVIQADLSLYADKTLACLGFYEVEDSNEQKFGPLRTLFGWEDNKAFNKYVRSIYNPKKTKTVPDRSAIIPSNVQVYMDSMVKAHEDVISLCRQNVEKRNT